MRTSIFKFVKLNLNLNFENILNIIFRIYLNIFKDLNITCDNRL